MYSLRSVTRAVRRRTARAVRTPAARRFASAPSRAVAQAAAATALAVVGVGTVGGAQLAAAAPSTTTAVASSTSMNVLATSARTTTSPSSAIAAAAVSPSAASQMVLLVAADGPSAGTQSVASVSGCGLTWSLVRRANGTQGTSEVWSAAAPTALTSCAPSAKLTQTGYLGAASLYAVSGGTVTASAGTSARSGAAATTVNAPAGALVLAVGNDWNAAAQRTALANEALTAQYLASVGDTYWFQKATPSTTGSLVVGTSAPASSSWSYAAVALTTSTAPTATPTATATATPTATASPTATATPTSTATPTPTATASPSPTATATPTPTATATPTASPSPTATSTPVSTSTAMPGATNTGVPAGTVLTPSGSIHATTAGQVISNLDITGGVTVDAPNVVIKNSRIHGSGSGDGVRVLSGSVTVQDSEIYGFENAIGYDHWTGLRLNIHGDTGDGVKLGSSTTLQDSWIHDLTPAAGAHSDGGQMQSGVTNLVVRHNTIDMTSTNGANSALFLAPDLGPSTAGPVLVENNYLAGGGFTLYVVDGANGTYYVGNITVRNNVFGDSGYGPDNVNVPVTWSGNTLVNGTVVNP
ncbi:right-handed parallel beta-helix repeat-containing protein [Cellulomonas sp. NTE-D12]|uniref:right-handed parallel beta-helix repeat-containing protein n=1 Tax=Cellulomonas sp. NTE-D12 TaxID=2962632 RepID=UPI003081E524